MLVLESDEAHAWVTVLRGQASPLWGLFRGPTMRSKCLTDEGKGAVLLALDWLQRLLGHNWVSRCMDKRHPFLSMEWWPINDVPHVYINLLYLAACCRLLQRQRGFGRVLRQLRTNLDYHSWVASREQLELGAHAVRHGCQLEFEPALASGKRGDLYVRQPAGDFMVEMVYRGTSDLFRESNRFYEQIRDMLLGIERQEGVWFCGTMGPIAAAEEIDEWLPRLLAAVSSAKHRGSARIAGPVGGELVVNAGQRSTQAKGIAGPDILEDGWTKLSNRLIEKAQQSHGTMGVWVWICDGGGLWQFTPWAQLSMSSKLEQLAPLVRDVLVGFPHVLGAVVTSGEHWPVSSHSTAEERTEDGVAIRSSLSFGRVRETLVIHSNRAASLATAQQLALWYLTESSFTNWLFETSGFCLPDRLVAD